MSEPTQIPEEPVFAERPTEYVIRDAFLLGALLLVLAGLAGLVGLPSLGFAFMVLTIFTACFFRNPPRFIPGDESVVVAPAESCGSVSSSRCSTST
jgi:hypothetical protein